MNIELVSILVLVAIFLLGTLRNINLGLLGLTGAFLLAPFVPAFDGEKLTDATFAGFPVDLMFSLMGLTFLFGFAQNNGTVNLILGWCMRLVRGNRAVMPWVFFAIAGFFQAIGAIFAIGIISPIAVPFARRYGINQLMMGMMVVHGAMAGLLSPLSIYGIYVNGFLNSAGLGGHEGVLFLLALVFNTLVGVVVYLVLGGRDLLRGGGDAVAADVAAESRPRGSGQWLTLAALAALVVGAGVFGVDIGMLSIGLGTLLAVAHPKAVRGAMERISWPTIVLVGGVVTYIAVLEAAGTVEYVSGGIAALGAPLIGLVLLCYMSGVVSALASSIATIGIAITMAEPFLTSGDLPVAGTAAAIAIAATVVDVSPFSTNGAMVLANVHPDERDGYFRQMLAYSGVVVALGPLLAWTLAFLPF